MSTISSPRHSVASSRAQSPAPPSSRPSLDILNNNHGGGLSTSSTPSTARALSPNPNPRRNRSALRDYYNLKPPGSEPGPHGSTNRSRSVPRTDAGDMSQPTTLESGTELDSADFDPQRYVDHLLSTSSLLTILKAENTLVGDIRTLDGERKALVYDNYSKLIRAVETIGKMRRSMDDRSAPLTMTKTLGPAIAFVAETAGGLIKEGEELRKQIKEARSAEPSNKMAEKETVRWVLAAPERLEKLISENKKEDAENDWKEVQHLLDAWGQVKGVDEVRQACKKVMEKARQGEE
ncbi:hypothetical protein N7495_009777 [Penicillium taxi]|uniref:uncharacterized protein n=1 Tax=Penicillium taxi TaxID=168475 RepID=UPI00254595F7|nr:uncharacterized protein N7495_009777 [Penicillium taxi]KAJ5885267.1 hypothetical protein N7495_009777 [Penicillium taxi]